MGVYRRNHWKIGSIILCCLGLVLVAFSLPYFAPLFQSLYQCDFLGRTDLALCGTSDLYHHRPWQRFMGFDESLFYGMAFFVGARVAGDAARLHCLGKGMDEPIDMRQTSPTVVTVFTGTYHIAQFAVIYLAVVWLVGFAVTGSIRNGTALTDIRLEGAIFVISAAIFLWSSLGDLQPSCPNSCV